MNNKIKGPSSRETALKIMYRVEEEGAYANIELNKVLSNTQMDKQDRSLVTQLVYGTIRMRGNVDYILSQFLKNPLNKITPWIRLILRLGVYQMIFMDKIPDRAAVNESVNLSKKYGHPGTVKLVNGVLRNVARNKETLTYPALEKDAVNHIAVVYSHPKWLVKRWIKQLGVEETINLCAANNSSLPVTVRTNTLKIDREQLIDKLDGEGVLAKAGDNTPESITLEGLPPIASLPSFKSGLFQVQDESSMLVAHVLGAKAGDQVIDVCAAPGGKTTHIAQTMNNTGVIKAFDLHQHKLGLISESCQRLGINIIDAAQGDSRNLPANLKEWADCVLVDAPCSGLGVLRRRPDSRWNKSAELIEELVDIQKDILKAAAQTVKPGGVLVYSTCTISPEENESMVQGFLQSHPDFALEPITSLLPFSLGEKEKSQADKGMLQLLPQVHGTDGFFISKMRRKKL